MIKISLWNARKLEGKYLEITKMKKTLIYLQSLGPKSNHHTSFRLKVLISLDAITRETLDQIILIS